MNVGPSLALYRRLYLNRPRPLGGTLAPREGRRRLSQRRGREEDAPRLETAPDECGRQDDREPEGPRDE